LATAKASKSSSTGGSFRRNFFRGDYFYAVGDLSTLSSIVAVRFHQSLQGDIFLISPRSTALIAMESFPETTTFTITCF
jgi:hypothetical protein